MATLDGRAGLRRVAHLGVASVLHYSGALSFVSWFSRRVLRRRSVIVIGLHRVLSAEEIARSHSEPAMIVSLATFERIVETLRKSYRVVALSEMALLSQADSRRPLCMITFDDAWHDTFENAGPVLRKNGINGVVFVPTALVGEQRGSWVERLARLWPAQSQALAGEIASATGGVRIQSLDDAIAELKKISCAGREALIAEFEAAAGSGQPDAADSFASWADLEKSKDVLEIASHTVNHALLTREEAAVVGRELAQSQQELESRLGQTVTAFAYPSGDCNDEVRGAVKRAGYAYAFTTRVGRFAPDGDPLMIPRALLHEGSVTGLNGAFSPALFHLRMMGWR